MMKYTYFRNKKTFPLLSVLSVAIRKIRVGTFISAQSVKSVCNPQNPRLSVCNPLYPRNKGFAALLAVIIIGAAALIIALNSSLLGLGELDLGYTSQKGDEAFSIADGCMEEVFRRLRINPALAVPPSILISSGSCSVTALTNSGSPSYNITVTVVGCTATTCPSTSGYSKKIYAELNITNVTTGENKLNITRWEELSS